jgi:hypothetical protein
MKLPYKRVKNDLFPVGDTPFRGDLAQGKHLLGKKWPIRGLLYDKNTRGVPMLLGIFCPFFRHILVQNGLFIDIRKSNFMGK